MSRHCCRGVPKPTGMALVQGDVASRLASGSQDDVTSRLASGSPVFSLRKGNLPVVFIFPSVSGQRRRTPGTRVWVTVSRASAGNRGRVPPAPFGPCSASRRAVLTLSAFVLIRPTKRPSPGWRREPEPSGCCQQHQLCDLFIPASLVVGD